MSNRRFRMLPANRPTTPTAALVRGKTMKHRRNAITAAGILFFAAPLAMASPALAGDLTAGSAATAPMTTGTTGDTTAGSAATASTPATTQDELTQLRANQELLQQRLDQLEQIAQVGPERPHLPPGTTSLAGSFPRSFLIPGTDTSISISGQIDFSMTEWFNGGNANIANTVVPTVYGNAYVGGLPLAGTAAAERSDDVFGATVYNSRLHVETRTPTAFGEADTVLEFDFGDCAAGGASSLCSNATAAVDPLIPRLRLAYATLGPWMFGQNWGIGFDLAAQPELFDTGGTVGGWGIARIPEGSYTFALPTVAGQASLQVGLIMPQSSMASSAGGPVANDTEGVGAIGIIGCNGCEEWLSENPLKNEWPDPAFALTWQQPWGHLQLHGALHDTYLDDGAGLDRSYLGYGGGFSGDVHPFASFGWLKDDVGFNAQAGQGEGHYAASGSPSSFFEDIATNFGGPGSGCYGAAPTEVGSMNPLGCAATGHNASLVAVALPTEFGAEAWIQHWWTPTVRSTADFGFEHQDLDMNLIGFSTLTDGLNKTEELAHVNLIWSPVPFVNTGLEFFWGRRVTVAHDPTSNYGTEAGLDYDFIMKF